MVTVMLGDAELVEPLHPVNELQTSGVAVNVTDRLFEYHPLCPGSLKTIVPTPMPAVDVVILYSGRQLQLRVVLFVMIKGGTAATSFDELGDILPLLV